EALQQGLKAESGSLSQPGRTPGPVVLPWRQQLQQPLALAASVLVAVLGVRELTSSDTTRQADTAMGVGAVLLLEPRRTDALPEFSGTGPYLLQIDAGLDARGSSAALELMEAGSGTLLLQQAGLQVDADG